MSSTPTCRRAMSAAPAISPPTHTRFARPGWRRRRARRTGVLCAADVHGVAAMRYASGSARRADGVRKHDVFGERARPPTHTGRRAGVRGDPRARNRPACTWLGARRTRGSRDRAGRAATERGRAHPIIIWCPSGGAPRGGKPQEHSDYFWMGAPSISEPARHPVARTPCAPRAQPRACGAIPGPLVGHPGLPVGHCVCRRARARSPETSSSDTVGTWHPTADLKGGAIPYTSATQRTPLRRARRRRQPGRANRVCVGGEIKGAALIAQRQDSIE